MSVMRRLKKQDGAALLSVMLFLIMLGMLGLSMATLVVSDAQVETLRADKLRAFYAAHSGLEYGIKRFLTSNVRHLRNWREQVDTGGGTYCVVSAYLESSTKVRIEALGYAGKTMSKLQKNIEFIDVSRYAVYATGKVEYTVAKEWPFFFHHHSAGLIYENAPVMPIFDLDELRQLAKPNRYYPGDLVVNHFFNFSPRRITFVEGNIYFVSWNWFNFGHFVSMGDVIFQSAWLPFSTTFGTVLQPTRGKQFVSKKSIFNRSFVGGIITNGNVIGSSNGAKFPYAGKLVVFHHRNTILHLMRYSVNGGPLVIAKSRWDQIR